jgi:hypothetical protein
MVDRAYFGEAQGFLTNELACSVVLIFRDITQENENYTFGRINIEEDVQEKIRKIFLKKYKSWSTHYDKFSFKKYKWEAPSEDILYLPTKDLDSPLITKDIAEVERINSLTDDQLEKLWGYIIHFADAENEELRVFVKYSEGHVLRKSRFDALFVKEGSFKPLKHDVFQMIYKIHAASFGDYLVIPAKYNFEQLFQMEKEIEKNAKKALKKIKELPFTFQNFSTFEKDCMNLPTAQRKLSNILSQSGWEEIDFKEVKKMKDNYNLSFQLDEKNKTLVYTNRSEMWDILHFLDDALLQSERTQARYEVGSKTRRDVK